MEDKTKLDLTAAEMSSLWAQYLNDTIAYCVTRYFLEKTEDEEIRPILQWAVDTSKENISTIKGIFEKESFPVPIGFTDQDVDPKAPRLFSDTFALMYLRQMSIISMSGNSSALGLATRPDVVAFHKHILNKAVELQDKTRDLMLKQGTYKRPPFIPVPGKANMVEEQSFLKGFFGKKRALTSAEISHLFFNIQANSVGKALITGFAQIAQNDDVKEYLLRGKKLSHKFIEAFGEFLYEEDLPVSADWDSEVLNTKARVFSDKLIMFNVTGMIAAGIGNFGLAMGGSQRKDVGLKYASLMPEMLLYAGDGAEIMIKHGWLEEPPLAVDRNGLIQG